MLLLPKKYKLRDSGVVLTDDEENGLHFGLGSATSGDYLNVMPRASTSVNSIYSDVHGLVTPGAGPGSGSGWPESAIVVAI